MKKISILLMGLTALAASCAFQTEPIAATQPEAVPVTTPATPTQPVEEEAESEEDDQNETDEAALDADVLAAEESDALPALAQWTFLVYMAADNNLESAAIADFNELERVRFPPDVHVLVLFDRAVGNDETNGNWTDTRLFSVSYDEHDANTIVSERLDCAELGLSKEAPTELDMANKATLAGLLAYAERAFPAEQYGFIMWGHGTGWRGDSEAAVEPTRAFAIDDYSETYMSIAEVRAGIEAGLNKMTTAEKLAIIGFDTCFGICMETAYELRNCAEVLLGTPALVPANGWNYTQLFSLFLASEQQAWDFAHCALEQYQTQYETYAYASFSAVACEYVTQAVADFNAFSAALAQCIDSAETRTVVHRLLQDDCVTYRAATFPCDNYFDVAHFAALSSAVFPSVHASATQLLHSLKAAIPLTWNKKHIEAAYGMGVFSIAYQKSGIAESSHVSLYVNGSRAANQCQFVLDCPDYVPTASCSGSLLDKLFYVTF